MQRMFIFSMIHTPCRLLDCWYQQTRLACAVRPSISKTLSTDFFKYIIPERGQFAAAETILAFAKPQQSPVAGRVYP